MSLSIGFDTSLKRWRQISSIQSLPFATWFPFDLLSKPSAWQIGTLSSIKQVWTHHLEPKICKNSNIPCVHMVFHGPTSLVTWWGRVRSSFARGSKKRRFTSLRGDASELAQNHQGFSNPKGKFQIHNVLYCRIFGWETRNSHHDLEKQTWYIWLVLGGISSRWISRVWLYHMRLKRFQNNVSATMQFHQHPSKLQEPPYSIPISST